MVMVEKAHFSRDPVAHNFLGSFLRTNSFVLLIQAYGSCAALVNFVVLIVLNQCKALHQKKTSGGEKVVGGVFLYSQTYQSTHQTS